MTPEGGGLKTHDQEHHGCQQARAKLPQQSDGHVGVVTHVRSICTQHSMLLPISAFCGRAPLPIEDVDLTREGAVAVEVVAT